MFSRSSSRPTPPRRRPRRRRRNRRRTPWRDITRKTLAFGLGLTAVLLLLAPDDQAGAAQSHVVVAARDLPAGTELSSDDVTTVEVATDQVPTHALTAIDAAVGEQVIGAVRRGEVLTDARLVGPPAFDVPSGYLPLVVTVTDAQSLLTIKEGDCVDIYAGYAGAPLIRVASSALLVTIADTPAVVDNQTGPPGTAASAPLVISVINDQVTAVIEALASDIVLATLCHAWPTSVD